MHEHLSKKREREKQNVTRVSLLLFGFSRHSLCEQSSSRYATTTESRITWQTFTNSVQCSSFEYKPQ